MTGATMTGMDRVVVRTARSRKTGRSPMKEGGGISMRHFVVAGLVGALGFAAACGGNFGPRPDAGGGGGVGGSAGGSGGQGGTGGSGGSGGAIGGSGGSGG